MTTRLTITKKRFVPVVRTLLSPSSYISGLLSDSDEDIIQKKEDVAKPQMLVNDDQTVGHQLVSSTPIHGKNSSKTNVIIWPSPIASQLPEQQNKPHKRNTKPKNKDLRKRERGNDSSRGRQRALQTNSTTGINEADLVASEEKDGLVIRQRVGSSTPQKTSHADPGKKVLPLQNSLHIITDSEEEINENESNNNAKAHRTESLKGLSPVKTTQHINTVRSVNQHVVTSTPLRRGRSSANVVSSLPSPIPSAIPPLAVETKRRTGTSQKSRAESGKMTVPAQKGSDCPAVLAGPCEGTEAKMKGDARKRRRFSRNVCKDDEENIVLFSTEDQNELKLGLSQNSHGSSSKRFNNITTENRRAYNSRKSSGLRAKTTKKKCASKVNKENKITSRKQLLKNQIEIYAEENACDGKKSSLNQDVRRSKRKRIKPLEYWRGERIQYKIGKDLCREVVGIDSGFPSRQWVGAAKRPVHYQKKGFQLPQKDIKGTWSRKMVLVPYEHSECELECFSTLRVESDSAGCQEQNFTVFTGLEVPGMSTGFVEIAPFCEAYSVVESNLVFHILDGMPIVTIHETTRNVKKGDFFFVPQGVHYTVRNDAERKAVLIFTKYDN